MSYLLIGTKQNIVGIVFFIMVILCSNSYAQEVIGLSYGYDIFPSVKLADPIEGSENLEIETRVQRIGFAMPLMFAEGKIKILNQFGYRRVDFTYKNFPTPGTEVKQAQSIQYTMFLIDSLSPKWSLVAVAVPGIASDFEEKLSGDDFTFQAIFGFIRKVKKNLELGFGLAYVRDFGKPIPLPFLYFNWNNGKKLKADGIVPTNMKILYQVHKKADIGLALTVMGDRHHGSVNKYGVDNPQMEYAEGTLSPLLQIHLKKWLHINVESGYAVYRNFTFKNGDKTEADYDLEPTPYIRAGLVLGI